MTTVVEFSSSTLVILTILCALLAILIIIYIAIAAVGYKIFKDVKHITADVERIAHETGENVSHFFEKTNSSFRIAKLILSALGVANTSKKGHKKESEDE